MRNFFLLLLQASVLLLACLTIKQAKATNYYFSSSAGDDSRSAAQAQNPKTPWKTLDKLNSFFSFLRPGDSVLFQRGDVFFGSIRATASGNETEPIVLSSFGTGLQPVITGLTAMTDWSAAGDRIWETAVLPAAEELNIVLLNGQLQPVGRFPNRDAANGGYLPVDNFDENRSITGAALSSAPNWKGGEVVIRKNRWVLDRNKITEHIGNTIFYSSESGYYPTAQYGYFVQNHPGTLDQNGEWCYQNGKLTLYSAAGSPKNQRVQVSVVPDLVTLFRQSNLLFSDLSFTGANKHAFVIGDAANVVVKNCTILFSGTDAFYVTNTRALQIEATNIDQTNNNALTLESCSSTVIRNNSIVRTGCLAGMGKGNSGSYEAILLSGNNNLVEGNRIDSTGYIPICFSGEAVVVRRNFINHFTLTKDDGGAIYTWNNGEDAPVYSNRRIEENIILHGATASDGTNDSHPLFSHGVYLDDNSTGVKVSGNTISDCEGFGIFVHNARDIVITKNTAYNNGVQLVMAHDDIAPNAPIRNTMVRDNVFFSVLPSQPVAQFKSNGDDIGLFGDFDANFYCRPFDENAVIGVLKKQAGESAYEEVDLEGWKAMYGKDALSKGSFKTFLPYNITTLLSSNKVSNGTFDQNIGGLYGYAADNQFQLSWSNGALDGGTLAAGFMGSATKKSKGTIIIGVGELNVGKKYRLRFSLRGSNENKMLSVYLRKSLAPYNDVTNRQWVKIKGSRKEVELLFTVYEATADGSIGIDVPAQAEANFLDNLDLREVAAVDANIPDSLRLFYNVTGNSATFQAPKAYTDVKGGASTNVVSLPPYASAVLLASADLLTLPVNLCTASGSILYEQWNNLGGKPVMEIPNSGAAITAHLTAFEEPKSTQANYLSRTRGFICPPQSGRYTFWIAGDAATELWLSTSSDPAKKVKIASTQFKTGCREWNRSASQKSHAVSLLAGQKYYIEALHTKTEGDGCLSVSWQLPDETMEAPIAGSRLSPYTVSIRNRFKKDAPGLNVFPNPFFGRTSVEVKSNGAGRAEIDLFDGSGKVQQKLFSGELNTGEFRQLDINTMNLPTGIYFIRFSSTGGVLNAKVVKGSGEHL